jgi:hypothetical protein
MDVGFFWLNYHHQKSCMFDFDHSPLLIHGIMQEQKDQTFCLRAPTHLANPQNTKIVVHVL